MKISDFDYDLPPELIAQMPIEPRDASRLLVVNRASGRWEHRHFRDLGAYLRPGDLLIANQSRVLPARLLGHRAETGGAVEVLLLTERPDLGPDCWETLVRPGRRLHEDARIEFDHPTDEGIRLHAEVLQRTEAGGRIVQLFLSQGKHHKGAIVPDSQHHRALAPENVGTCFSASVDPTPNLTHAQSSTGNEHQAHDLTIRQCIDQIGHMPLPPYIHETLTDPERYQTVYARIRGSAAAPTAGLHFTPQLLDQLRQQGIRIGFVTLHVGLDTFRPIECEDISEHTMHSEEIELDAPTAELINQTRQAGGRIIAVGTTSVRVLEGIASLHNGQIIPYHGHTRLFITPGYHFHTVDALITNFHLPRSTLLLLVSAFMGKSLMEQAYQAAIRERYRFFSFGDAMVVV
jgi:S-adenosylmethionine:tRNA ribosyltransferase-isomerase